MTSPLPTPVSTPPNGRGALQAGGEFAPWVEWPDVQKMIDVMWDPENSPHQSVIGLTGSGKSFLCIEGMLKPLCKWDRVLIIDCKRNDKLVSSIGRPCTEIPPKSWARTRKREPYDSWHRLIVHDQFDRREAAKLQVYKALKRCYNEGNWIIYVDEAQDLAGTRLPNLGLGMHLDEVYRKGRSRGISILAGTQAPRHVATSFYDQCSFAWIGRLADEDKQKRLREIGGMPKEALPAITSLKKREWLLSADNGETFLRTTVKV
jgi:hypothetical protein